MPPIITNCKPDMIWLVYILLKTCTIIVFAMYQLTPSALKIKIKQKVIHPIYFTPLKINVALFQIVFPFITAIKNKFQMVNI